MSTPRYAGVNELLNSLDSDIKRLQPPASGSANASEAMLRPLYFVASQVQHTHVDLCHIYKDQVVPMFRGVCALQPAIASLQRSVERVHKSVDTSDLKAQLFVLQETVSRVETTMSALNQRVIKIEHASAMALEKFTTAEATHDIMMERLRRVEACQRSGTDVTPPRKRTFAEFMQHDDLFREDHTAPPAPF